MKTITYPICFALLSVTLIMSAPSTAYAWGPRRNVYTLDNPPSYNTFNSITDNPNYGDERNFFRVRPSNKNLWSPSGVNGWTDTLFLEEGNEYTAMVYVNNCAADNLNLYSEDTKVLINLPLNRHTYGRQFEINSYISSSNSKPNEIWDNIVLLSSDPFHLEVISAHYINNANTEADGGFAMGDELFTDGALVGYEKMDGRIKGSYSQSGYVLVKFRPVYKDSVMRFFQSLILDKLDVLW